MSRRRHTPAERVIGKGKGLPMSGDLAYVESARQLRTSLVFLKVSCVHMMIRSMIQSWRVLPPHDRQREARWVQHGQL
jgi:hypothetical protein